ncbi:MAG: 50S ribosomal protein L15, partial [Nanoarchaeota archaeon]|nr:50S ribosomal protein L15 [Nanoarchaeota archaeon]
MSFHKRKKNSRQRAGTTHGWGAMKKHRGSGNRGGVGMAGSGKRGDSIKPLLWKNKRYFGIHGFASRFKKLNAINLEQIDDNAESWAKKGKIEKKENAYTVDLKKLGYDKLLGTGKVTKKLEISVDHASPGAVEKVKKAGGSVKILIEKKEKKEK